MSQQVAEEAAEERLRPSRAELKRELRRLSREFADQVLDTLERHGVFDEPTSVADDPKPKRVRRTGVALLRVSGRVLEVLETERRPMSISEVAKAVRMTTRAVAHPLSMLVAEGRITCKGERRGARYQAVRKAKPSPAKTKKKAKKAKKKKRASGKKRASKKD